MNHPSTGHPKLTCPFFLQPAQHFLINIPLLQDRKNRLGPKPRARQLAKNARRLLLIFWFLQSLAAQILPRLLLFIYFFIGCTDGLLDHPTAPEFFVIAAEG